MIATRESVIGVAVGALACATATGQDSIRLDAAITSVSVFKNGLAVVHREIEVPGPGAYEILEIPDAAHGTFWIDSPIRFSAVATSIEVEEEAIDAPANWSGDELQGREVTVTFKDANIAQLEGVVVHKNERRERWRTDYGWERPRASWGWYGNWNRYSSVVPEARGNLLVIEARDGVHMIDRSQIAALRVGSRVEPAIKSVPALRIDIPESEPIGAHTLSMVYLTKGASWAPSYSLELSSDDSGMVRQKAVVRSELEDLHDVEIFLVTGVPGFEYGHVLSPISPATGLAAFFQALGTVHRPSHSTRTEPMSQMVSMRSGDYAPPTMPEMHGLGEQALGDLVYSSIGKVSLRVGETLVIETEQFETPVERFVSWNYQDRRDEWGARRSDRDRHEIPAAYDTIQIQNMAQTPLTTGPIVTLDGAKLLGQTTLRWTAPGETQAVKVNRALAVRVTGGELETKELGQAERRYGWKVVSVQCEGRIVVQNLRQSSQSVRVSADFGGELISATPSSKTKDRLDPRWRLNPAKTVEWELTLDPGEERVLEYAYKSLRRRS